eukprot:jgi/Tetstr1/436317/TSEL_025156.t1
MAERIWADSLSSARARLEALLGGTPSWQTGLGVIFTLLSLAAGARYGTQRRRASRRHSPAAAAGTPRRPPTAADGADDPPEDLCCPISLNLMRDPVLLCATGQVYDYPNLRAWLTLGNMLCPKTNMPMFDVQVVRLTALKQRCWEWAEAAGTPLTADRSPRELRLHELHPELPDWLNTVRTSGSLDKRGTAAARINDLMVQWTSGGTARPESEAADECMKQLKQHAIDDLLWMVRYGKNYGKGCSANALSCFTLPKELAWIAVCGAVPLVALLQSPDAYAQQAAARVINNIVHGSEIARDTLGNAGAVQGLLWQVERKASNAVSYTRAPAAQALWGLAHSTRWRTAILNNSGLRALKNLVHEGNRYEQRDAAGALLQMQMSSVQLAPLTRRYLLQLRHCSQEWLHEEPGAELDEVDAVQEVAVHQYM